MNKIQFYSSKILTTVYLIISLLQPITVYAHCTSDEQYNNGNKHEALKYKLAAIASILLASTIGVCIPLLFKNASALNPERCFHFLVKSFAAGVILATGFIHILPVAFISLTSPCLTENSWGSFPFTGFVSMMSAILSLLMEAFATGYHRRAELSKALVVNGEEERDEAYVVHGQAIMLQRSNSSDLLRHRVMSQVLELGIVVHSVIIGISLGATQSTKTIKPLIAALSFHQFFDGIGLGGCISQAKLKGRATTIMVVLFSLTTPTGIAIGIAISKIYNAYSSTALVIEGLLNSASAGILIYMALVDLLASDFMNPKLQTNFRLQIGTSVTLLLGAGCMSLLVIWV